MTIRLSALSGVLAAVLLASACQSPTTASDVSQPTAITAATPPAEATPTAEPEPTATVESDTAAAPAEAEGSEATTEADAGVEDRSNFSPELARFLSNLSEGYRTASKAWAGFDPDEHPVVLAIKSGNDQLTGALAINHPTPEIFDEATQLDTTGTPLRSLHLATGLNAADTAALDALRTFDFNAEVGGSNVFLIVAGGSNPTFDPTSKRYVSTLLHEMFHRYQGQTFRGEFVQQDIDGYDYSASNIELIALEDRALAAAIDADSEEARELAVRHVVAIRQVRLAADSRVVLDGLQEMREGTARFVEHRLASTDEGFGYNLRNFDRALIDDVPTENVKANLAFGRWYASGAAALQVLRQLGVENIEALVEEGMGPIGILAQTIEVEDSEAQGLVNEARAIYDPTGELTQQAALAAEAVLSEPPFWGDLGGSDDGGRAADLTPEIVACLEAVGVDFETGQITITAEEWEGCGVSGE